MRMSIYHTTAAQDTVDVLIIGGGLAAMVAADALADTDARVLVLRAGGGASPFVHGFSLPMLPSDSAAVLMQDTLRAGCGQCRPELVRALCAGTAEIPQQLARWGISLNQSADGPELLRPLGASYPRVVSVGNSAGNAILHALHARLADRSNVMRRAARAERLISDGCRVTGAVCRDASGRAFSVAARATLLACGGYSGILPFTTNPDDLSGSGLAMAYDAGAALTDLEFIQFEPCVGIAPEAVRGKGIVTTMLYEGAVLRDASGAQFLCRYGADGAHIGKDLMAQRIQAAIRGGNASPHGGVYFDATGVGAERLHAVYGSYVARYARCGIDLVRTPVEVAPAAHTALGGVEIDPQCHTSLRGLYACGEAAGGLHGANRMGGNAGLETLVFGEIAGQTIAAEWASMPLPDAVPVPDTPAQVLAADERNRWRIRLDEAVGAALNVVRDDESLAVCRETLAADALAADALPDGGDVRGIRQRICAARLVAAAAQIRGQSVGCHVRSDSRPEPEPYALRVQKDRGIVRIDLPAEQKGGEFL